MGSSYHMLWEMGQPGIQLEAHSGRAVRQDHESRGYLMEVPDGE